MRLTRLARYAARSVVIYDEAQQPHLYPSNAQRGPVTDERLTAMETHRHTGTIFGFITQAPTFIHHPIFVSWLAFISTFTGREASRGRPNMSGRMFANRLMTGVSKSGRPIWCCGLSPKRHFDYYTSAVMHTHKFRMPKKSYLPWGVFIVALLIVAVWLGLSSVSGFSSAGELTGEAGAVEQATAPTPPPTTTYSWSSAPEAVPVAGCIANESTSRCMCFPARMVSLLTLLMRPVCRSSNLLSLVPFLRPKRIKAHSFIAN